MSNNPTKWPKEVDDDWEGKHLDPLDTGLRKFIIHCGERCQCLVDAFNNDKGSKWNGFSRYPPDENFFSYVGLEYGHPYKYVVTNFFYARAEKKFLHFFGPIEAESNWMGFVAVATDEGKAELGRRDILITWRGTMAAIEQNTDIDFPLVSAKDVFGSDHPKVHEGWHSIYTAKASDSTFNKSSAREQVLNEVRRLVDLYNDEEISITVAGHSMGAGVATLNAVDIAFNGYNVPTGQPDKACMVSAIVFASPKVGDSDFNNVYSGLENLHVLRINNENDIVPNFPIFLYTHVGKELKIDTSKSPYIKDSMKSPGNAHQLELYLHGVAGTHGPNGEFKLDEVKRDISLVNKTLDALKDEYNVPTQWWIGKNKGMVQQKDGSWKYIDYYEPIPPTAL